MLLHAKIAQYCDTPVKKQGKMFDKLKEQLSDRKKREVFVNDLPVYIEELKTINDDQKLLTALKLLETIFGNIPETNRIIKYKIFLHEFLEIKIEQAGTTPEIKKRARELINRLPRLKIIHFALFGE